MTVYFLVPVCRYHLMYILYNLFYCVFNMHIITGKDKYVFLKKPKNPYRIKYRVVHVYGNKNHK